MEERVLTTVRSPDAERCMRRFVEVHGVKGYRTGEVFYWVVVNLDCALSNQAIWIWLRRLGCTIVGERPSVVRGRLRRAGLE